MALNQYRTPCIITEFRRALETSAVVKYSTAALQRRDVRIAQAQLQKSNDQLPGFLPQSLQLLEINRQETREAHQANQRCQTKHANNPKDKVRRVVGEILLQERSIRDASYRQQGEQSRYRYHALQAARVTPNLRHALVQPVALFTVIIKYDVPQKRRLGFMLAHNRCGFSMMHSGLSSTSDTRNILSRRWSHPILSLH
jgi:hypothetical protein